MSVSGSLGRSATVGISTDGGSSYTDIGGVQEVNFDDPRDVHDITANDDGLGKVELVGHYQATLTFNCVYDPSDTGQSTLLDSKASGTQRYFRVRPFGAGAGKEEITAKYTINVTRDLPTQGAAMLNATLTSSGDVTETTQ